MRTMETEIITSKRFLNKKDAEDMRDWLHENYNETLEVIEAEDGFVLKHE